MEVCTCPQGLDSLPCSHQAAVSIRHDKALINSIPTLALKICQMYAQIALGDKAYKSLYAGLHDTEVNTSMKVDMFNPNFTSPTVDLIQCDKLT